MIMSVNIFAVIAAAVVSTIIGFAWYSPFLFGRQWMELMGLSMDKLNEEKSKGMGKIYGISFVADAVTAGALAYILSLQLIFDARDAVMLAGVVWVGFFVPVMLGSVLWEQKSWKLFAINVGYRLAALVGMALVVGLWQ
jgi:hypothetical protein